MKTGRQLVQRRCLLLIGTPLVGISVLSICCLSPAVPDQTGFAPLDELATNGRAVVRLYSAPIPGLGGIATHSWFLIKEADSAVFDRWELWQTAGGAFGHIRRNLLRPESDVGAGGVFVIAELIGDRARPVVAFIRDASPSYPCRNTYFVLGPNSNTYPQWVLDNTGWDVTLPATAIGKDAAVDCP